MFPNHAALLRCQQGRRQLGIPPGFNVRNGKELTPNPAMKMWFRRDPGKVEGPELAGKVRFEPNDCLGRQCIRHPGKSEPPRIRMNPAYPGRRQFDAGPTPARCQRSSVPVRVSLFCTVEEDSTPSALPGIGEMPGNSMKLLHLACSERPRIAIMIQYRCSLKWGPWALSGNEFSC